jgi:molecular chaperone HtpG
MYSIVLNTNHSLIKDVLAVSDADLNSELAPIDAEIRGLKARKDAINQSNKDKKYDEISKESKDDLSKCEEDIRLQMEKKNAIIDSYAKNQNKVHQLIDLALLQNGMLKGESLAKFVERSLSMI